MAVDEREALDVFRRRGILRRGNGLSFESSAAWAKSRLSLHDRSKANCPPLKSLAITASGVENLHGRGLPVRFKIQSVQMRYSTGSSGAYENEARNGGKLAEGIHEREKCALL